MIFQYASQFSKCCALIKGSTELSKSLDTYGRNLMKQNQENLVELALKNPIYSTKLPKARPKPGSHVNTVLDPSLLIDIISLTLYYITKS